MRGTLGVYGWPMPKIGSTCVHKISLVLDFLQLPKISMCRGHENRSETTQGNEVGEGSCRGEGGEGMCSKDTFFWGMKIALCSPV